MKTTKLFDPPWKFPGIRYKDVELLSTVHVHTMTYIIIIIITTYPNPELQFSNDISPAQTKAQDQSTTNVM